jgi:recombination protein RecR
MASLATPKAVQRLIDEFSRLPGIGPKSASRLTYFLLRGDGQQPRDLAAALVELKERTRACPNCFNITDAAPVEQAAPGSATAVCAVCADPARQNGLVCVVEEPLDVLAIERTREFKGRYHVLGGAISPVEGVGPEDLKIRELVERLQREPVREVILATNISLEGEATAMYLQKQIAPLGVRVTRLARGLPVGGDLEYADETTLARALQGRSEMGP